MTDLTTSQKMRDFSHHSSWQRKRYAEGWRSKFSQKQLGWRARFKFAWKRFWESIFHKQKRDRMLAKLRKDRQDRRYKPTRFKRLERFERRKFRRSGHR